MKFFLSCLTFVLGCAICIYVSAQIFLPLLYSLPRSIYLYFKGELKFRAIPTHFIPPLIWIIGLVVLGYVLEAWAPAVMRFTETDTGFILGGALSLPFFLLQSFLTKKGRAEMKEDYERTTGQRFRKRPDVPLTAFLGQAIATILNNDFDIAVVDPEQVLSTTEQQAVVLLAKPFALAMLFRETLNQIRLHHLNLSGETLVKHFVCAIYANYEDKQVPDLAKSTEQAFQHVQKFVQDVVDIAPESDEVTPDAAYAIAFMRNALPEYNVTELPPTKFGAVSYFCLTLQETMKESAQVFFDSATVTV